MSMAVYVDGEYVADAATNFGWVDFARWLSQTGKGELKFLARYGWTGNPERFAGQLEEAMEEKTMTEDQKSVALGLLRVAKEHATAEVIAVSDGFGEE